jgi:hypothetical protein
MINEEKTFKEFGYKSKDLSYGSGKKVYAICNGCGKERCLTFHSCGDLCNSCAQKGKKLSEEHKRKLSKNSPHLSGKNHPMYGRKHSRETREKIGLASKGRNKGKVLTEKQKQKISKNHADFSGKNNPFYGKHLSEEHKQRLLKSHQNKHLSEETKKKISAAHQGIPYSEWKIFAVNSSYCPAFNSKIKEEIREKYNRECFICGCLEEKNITLTSRQYKLSVHHVDMNKQQGCDGHQWKLIPLCLKCHKKGHNKRMISCIIYMLENERRLKC